MNHRPLLTFLVFLALSTALWLLIKLSEDYTTQTEFRVALEDVPAEKWVSSPEQSVKLTMEIDGFHMLKYEMIREAKREVAVSLDKVPYRQEGGVTYSFNSQYVAEQVADRLDVNVSNLTMHEAKVYFNMEDLASKAMPIELRSDLKLQRPYNVYGLPILDPPSVTVYGPREVLDTLKTVKTTLLVRTNVDRDFSATLALDLLDGLIRSNVQTVNVKVVVEKFTETDIQVPFRAPDSLKMRFFPETMTVKCHVAVRDYPKLKPEDFHIAYDATQLKALEPLLDVHLETWPQYVQIMGSSPDKVEYVILR